jgi:hypothetical protein
MIEPGSPPFTEADFIAAFWGPFGQPVTFSLLVAAGIVFMRRRELHKRLMVFSLVCQSCTEGPAHNFSGGPTFTTP